MKDWIKELCPEIADWQVEMIAEQAQREIAAEREACAKFLETGVDMAGLAGEPMLIKYTVELLVGCAAAIRSRGNQ